jgi:Leucine-rich repeat (LRR) protein
MIKRIKNNSLPFSLFLLLFVTFTPKSFSQSTLLDSLTLDTLAPFTSIVEAMKSPEKVIKLELRKKKLKEFPKEIFQMKNLQYLDLSKNNITEVPAEIAELKDLQILILSKNSIETLPKEIGELKQLPH